MGNEARGYLESLDEFMHGHRKKTLFFIDCLERYSIKRGLRPSEIYVLDVGCGNGRNVTLPVAELGFQVTGIDLHRPSIEAATSYNRLANAQFFVKTVQEHQPDRPYDVVILSDVLEHVPDPGAMLDAILRLLSPNGLVLISVPNGYGPFEIEQFLVRRKILAPLLWITTKLVSIGVRLKRGTSEHVVSTGETFDPLTSNEECGHVHFFSQATLRRLVYARSLRIERQRNGAWFGGDLTYFLFYFFPRLVPITLRVADHLPPRLVSTWYFECSWVGDVETTAP